MLGAHDAVGAAICLACDHRQLGHGRLAERIEQLGPVADDAAVLLRGARQESRHVDECDERDVECVAETDESSRLHGRVDVEGAGHHLWLVGDDPDRVPVEVGEPDHDVHPEEGLHFEEVAAVDDHPDHVLDVVRLFRVVRDDVGEPRSRTLGVVGCLRGRRLLVGALGDVREQAAHLREALVLRLRQEMRDS